MKEFFWGKKDFYRNVFKIYLSGLKGNVIVNRERIVC